ncbi:MAG: HPP family protein [Daejeonella sp.]
MSGVPGIFFTKKLLLIPKYIFGLFSVRSLDRNNWIYKQYFPKTLHPPGGATALIANIGSEQIKALGYLFVLSPVLTGVLILFVVAIFF